MSRLQLPVNRCPAFRLKYGIRPGEMSASEKCTAGQGGRVCRLKHVVATYQQQLLKPCPFLITLPRAQEPDDVFPASRSALEAGVAGLTGTTSASASESDELPQIEDFNRFVVPIMTYERDLRRFLSARQEEESWEEILYRNGVNPLCSLLSLCYFFLSDVLDAQQLQQQQRSQLLNSLGDGPNLWRH